MKKITTALSLVILSSFAMANEAHITRQLQKLGMTQIEVKPSPVKGLKTVVTNEGVLYVSDDGQYVLHGKLFEISEAGITNVTDKLLLDKLNSYKNEMIVYPAKNEKYVVTVFMDITCHYCHLLHSQIKEYNDLGITISYLAFPRAGLNHNTAKQMEAIWAAEDPMLALNEAESGRLPKTLKEPNIVKKHYELGLQFNVRGTPNIILPNGELLGGYLKPQDLLAALKESQ